MHDPTFWFALLIFSASLVSFIFTSLFVYKKLSKTEQKGRSQNSDSSYDSTTIAKHSVSEVADRVRSPNETDPTQLTHSLLLEVMPSDSSKWAGLFDERGCDDPNREVTDEGQIGKKKKRKAKKKKMNSLAEDEGGGERANSGSDSGLRLESVCLYPFTSSSSAMQRKIKQQYDELVKCNESKTLTLPQVIYSSIYCHLILVIYRNCCFDLEISRSILLYIKFHSQYRRGNILIDSIMQ